MEIEQLDAAENYDVQNRGVLVQQFLPVQVVGDMQARVKSETTKIVDDSNQKRWERICALRLKFKDSPDFYLENAEQIICGPYPDTDKPKKLHKAPSGLPSYLASLYDTPLLTTDQERYLFRLYNYYKFLASTLRDQGNTLTNSEIGMIEDLYVKALEAKNRILNANLRIVIQFAKKRMTDFYNRISDGNDSLMKAIECFDYTRGFKFSTYATSAIKNNFASGAVRQAKLHTRFQTGNEAILGNHLDGRGDPHTEIAAQSQREELVPRILERLNDRERMIIESRFGFGNKEPKTLQEIGTEIGVTKERVRQIEARAFDKLRESVPLRLLNVLEVDSAFVA